MRAAGPIQKFYWHNVPLAAEKVTRGLPVSSFNFLNLVGLGGFEPPTSSLGNCCSIHLSYSPTFPL